MTYEETKMNNGNNRARAEKDLNRKIDQLRQLLQTANYENYDFVYLPVGDALTVVQLLEDYRRLNGGRNHEPAKEHGEAVLP